MKAYRNLRERGISVRLLILGAFDSLHPSGLNEAEIVELKNDPLVLMPGWQENVAEWLAVSDLCIFPSEREGMPVCLMESISMGVPVITADSRGCRDVVQDGVDGYVLEDASILNLADQIEGLLKSPELLSSLRRASLAGRARFDRANYVAEQLSSLGNLLATV